MSAFILDNAHINVMLKAMSPGYPQEPAPTYRWKDNVYHMAGSTAEIGQKLVDENFRSVNCRYNENAEPYQFRSAILKKRYSPVEIIKACHCYAYQSCEASGWKESEAHAIMVALRERAVRRLPGYEDAPWGINDDEAPPAS